MVRTFKHTLTGRALRVVDGSRTARLVEADTNWVEDKPTTSAKPKEADSGSSNASGRGGGPGKGSQRKRGPAGRKSAD